VAEGFDDGVLPVQRTRVKPGLLVGTDISGRQVTKDSAVGDPHRQRPEMEVLVNPILDLVVGSVEWLTHVGESSAAISWRSAMRIASCVAARSG